MFVLARIAKLYTGCSADSKDLLSDVDLWVTDGRIEEVAAHDPARIERKAAEGVKVIAADTYTVTPGLVDGHGHVTILGLSGERFERGMGSESLLWVERVLYASLVDGGVTCMRDVGGATHRMKRLIDDGVLIGPRLRISICMLSSTGGHADFRGPDRCHAELSRLWPAAEGRPSSIVDGPWECRKRVREIAACGADLIKICSSPGVASPGDKLEHREFTGEEVAAICDEAAARGLKVCAHAHSKSGIDLAVENGVADLQHISFMDARSASRAAERGCSVTPTSWIMRELLAAEGLSEFVLEKARAAADAHRAAVTAARAEGLPIIAGTDPVLPGMHGRNFMEIAHLMDDGLGTLEAWFAMTGLAAEHCGFVGAGRIEAGAPADLLVANEDVLSNPSRLGEGALVEVVQAGRGVRGGLEEIPQRDFRSDVRAALLLNPNN